MSRPRTPTKLLEARGAFKNHPERKRDGEPQVKEPLGAVPERLDGLQVVAWQELASTAPLGVLTQADRLTIEEAARLLAESWESGTDFAVGKRALLNRMLGQVGMNPSDRSKLSIEKPKDVNPFDTLS